MGCVRTVAVRPVALRTIAVHNGLRAIAVRKNGVRAVAVRNGLRAIAFRNGLRPISLSDSFLARVRVTVTPLSNGRARAVFVNRHNARPIAVRTIKVC